MMSSLSQPADGENAGLSAGTTETAVSHGDASHPQTAAMRVYVRIRPFARRELLRDGSQPQSTLKLDAKEGYLHVLDPSRNFLTRHTYGFEYCFNSGEAGLHGDQEAVYRHVGLPVLHNVIDGYNGCVFAYGQTGSGKTYTMLGVAHASLPEKSNGMERGHDYPKQCNTVRRKVHPELSARNASTRFVADDIFREVVVDDVCYVAASEGIIPRLARDIFKTLRQKQTDNSTHSFRVEMEFYEIYNEKAFDLLANGCGGTMAELRVRHQATTGAYVDGLSRKHVTCERDMLKWIKRGGVERHTAFTKANDRSSRSHAILTIHIVQVNIDQRDNSNRVSSKLNLVDLAGSERTGASGVEGLHFKEATMINLSLTALGRVIDTLADISSGKQGIFCPYRDSNLTWVLMDSLGGNSRTTMVATVSPYIDHYDETCQTLRYASRAKQIVNTAVVNEDPQVRQIKMLTAEVARLKGLVGNNAACDFTNEEVDRLRHRVIELEQQLVERNLMLETLQSQAVDRRAFSKKQTACTVSSKSKAADDKMVLDSSEKDLGNTARRTSVSCSLMSQSIDSLPTRDGRPECHMPRRYLSNRTLQELKRLGISAEEDCIKLLESVTHCAYEATMNYESMCKKNTMMINSHSHALRENLHKIEAKEWSVLTSIGEKLIASMEEACKRHETSIRSCEKMCRSMSHGTFSVTPLSSLEGYNADDKRCFVCKAATPNKFMMKEEKENQKIEEKMRRQVSTGVADCDKIKRRAELSHKNVCGAQAKNEKTRKSGAVALTSVSRDTERSLELQKQYYAMRLRSFSKLAADNVEKFLKLYSKENCEWSCIMMRHYEEWNALQCRNARQGKSVDQRVKDGVKVLLPPEVSKLHQSIAGLAQCGCEATYSTGPVYNSQPNVLLCSFMQKIDVLRDSYESQICDLKERCLELAGAFAPTETKTQNEIENSSQKPHEEVVHTIESLKCQQKNCIKGTEEAKMPNGCTVEGQKNEGWKDIKLMGQDLMRYTAHVELQQHEAIKLGVIKGLVVLECVQGHYGQHVKQCSAQMDNVLQACSTKTNIVQQHYEQFVQKVLEEREKEREQVAATKQNKEELHLLRKECEYVKKQKEIACSLLSGVGTLMAAGDALRAEHMDAVLSTVGAAVTELAHQREEHVAAVDVLEREVVSARTAMEQQRAEFEKRALDLRTAHEREWLELADSSSLLVAECVSWRQAVAQEEAVARLDLVIDLQQSSMSCASREHAECLMLEGHVAFGEYCAREHAAWMDDAGEVLLEALGTCGSRAMEYARLQLADCSQCETEARAVLLECEVVDRAVLMGASRHCVDGLLSNDARVRELQDEMESVKGSLQRVQQRASESDQLLSAVGTLMAAGDALRAERMDAVLSTVGAAVTELAHQREEHVAAVDVLEREVVSARTAMEQQRAEFEKRALDLRTAHEREWLELADSSSLLVAECVSWRQAVAQEEAVARLDLVIDLQQSSMSCASREHAECLMLEGHVAFGEYCAREHAAWMDDAGEVLLEALGTCGSRAMEYARLQLADCSQCETEARAVLLECEVVDRAVLMGASRHCVDGLLSNDARVRELQDEMESVKGSLQRVQQRASESDQLLSAVGTLMAAGDALRAERMDAVLSTVGAAVTELAHQREEHVAAVDVLEREVVSARTAMEQQRAEFEKRALDLRTAHEREWLELADSSSLLVAECVSWRQAVAQEEAVARLDLVIDLQQSSMSCASREHAECLMLEGHVAFGEYCAREHAAWMDDAGEVLLEALGTCGSRAMEYARLQLADCSQCETEARAVLLECEVVDRAVLMGASRHCVDGLLSNDARVRELQDEMESVKGSLQRVQQRASESDQLLSAVGTLMAAGDALRAERMDAVLSTVGAAVTELAHQREEHVAAVDVLEREVVSARTAMEQQRAEFEKRALDLRTAHEREWLELADSSSLLVAECVSWRQAVAQEEAVARLDLVIDLQQSSMSCASREHAECLMLEGHVAFGEYCAREHAAWMDDAGEVLLEALGTCGSRAMEYARLQLADCSQCETEARAVLLECEVVDRAVLMGASRHCVDGLLSNDARVRELQDEMESVKGSLQRVQQRASESDQLLSAVGTLMAAGDALRAERMDAVLSTVGAAVTELAHQREEHVAAVDVLEREVVSARTAMEQQRAEFEKRALDLRTAHEREWLELADSSSLLVAECVSWRQAVAQEEAVARLDLVIDLQQSSMSCASREHAECLMLEGHVAFGEYCAREHAAWMDDAGEVLLEALGTCGSRAMEYTRLQLADCSQCETEARAVLLECEDSEYQLLVAYMNVRLGHCFELSKVFDAIVFGLCDPSSADSLTSDCSSYPHCLTLSPYVSCLIMLEQYRQLASLEYATYFSSLFESRNVSAFDSRREFEMTLSAVEEHHHDKLSQLIRENKSLEEKLQILRENLDFQANLEELEEEVLHDRTLSACGNVSSCRPLPSSGNAAVDLNNSSQRWEGLNFSNYLSSIFGRDMSSKGRSIAQRDISPQTRVQKRLKNELSDFCNNSASDMSRELYLTPPLHSPSSSMVWNSRNESFSQR